MPRFAVSLNLMFTEWPLLDRFAAAADAGFTAVEVQVPYGETPDAIARKLADNRQELILINTPRGPDAAGGRGLGALPGYGAEFREAMATVMRYVEATGVRKVHVQSGSGAGANAETFKDSLKLAADMLGTRGAEALLEPLNLRDNPGYFMSDFDLAARIIRELALPNVRLQYDVYHRQSLHGDIARSLSELMPIVGHVQIAGVPERHEPVDCEIDFGHVFRLLDKLGYTGWIGLEYRPRAGTREGLGWLERWKS